MEFRKKISRDSFLRLKAEIKARSAMGKALREEACRDRDFVRSFVRQMKTEHAARTRFLLLALAVLKGRKYRDVEPTSRANPYAPNAKSLAEFMSANVFLSYEYRQVLDAEVKTFFADEAKEAAA